MFDVLQFLGLMHIDAGTNNEFTSMWLGELLLTCLNISVVSCQMLYGAGTHFNNSAHIKWLHKWTNRYIYECRKYRQRCSKIACWKREIKYKFRSLINFRMRNQNYFEKKRNTKDKTHINEMFYFSINTFSWSSQKLRHFIRLFLFK